MRHQGQVIFSLFPCGRESSALSPHDVPKAWLALRFSFISEKLVLNDSTGFVSPAGLLLLQVLDEGQNKYLDTWKNHMIVV